VEETWNQIPDFIFTIPDFVTPAEGFVFADFQKLKVVFVLIMVAHRTRL
jgi:hypothetical protein